MASAGVVCKSRASPKLIEIASFCGRNDDSEARALGSMHGKNDIGAQSHTCVAVEGWGACRQAGQGVAGIGAAGVEACGMATALGNILSARGEGSLWEHFKSSPELH